MNSVMVSIVMPFYSNKEWLKEAIDSVQNQTYDNFELIVVNDGSPEDISDLVLNYQKDNRIKFEMKENGGPASARNLGIQLSRGKYIAFLDSDDIWEKEKLKIQIKEMEDNKAVWSHHSYQMFYDGTSIKKKVDVSNLYGDVYTDLYQSFRGQTSCFVVLKEALKENNIHFPNDKRFGQDIYFYLQLAKKYPLHYIDETLSYFRVRGTNAGFDSKIQLNNRAEIYTLIKNNPEVLKRLPKNVVKAYEISHKNNEILNNISERITSKRLIKFIAGLLYIRPYLMFHKSK